ncbi:MAG: anthranilate phosphoribosyltransferase [Halobacteriovoraceae bacterium]|nr:anthranilate phosphoribosyltransferase [Halobacteriovoraceae bacterium]
MKEILEKLYDGNNLSIFESQRIFKEILAGQVDPIIISSILTAFRVKKETDKEITGAALEILAAAELYPILSEPVGDIVGTGGDHSDTINVSTLSSITAAALGVKMAKHGNRSVSSKCGSFDLLEALNVNFMKGPRELKSDLEEVGICFLFAPLFHKSFKHVMPVRTMLKTRTIFNILGPLVNPVRPTYQMVGVYSKELLTPIAGVLNEIGPEHALVIHGNGLDEISPNGETLAIEVKQGSCKPFTLSPKTFGFAEFSIEEIKGGDKQRNLEKSLLILDGKGSEGQKKMIAMNVSPLLVMASKAKDYKSASHMAMDMLSTDEPMKVIKRLAQRK